MEVHLDGDLVSWWRSLDQREKQTASVVLFVLVYLFRNYLITVILVVTVTYYLSLRKPSIQSFEPFLESWYKTQYFPRVAAKVEAELRERARQRASEGNLVDALGDRAKGWLNSLTKGIQAAVLYEIIKSRPMRVQDKGAILSVTVNLGSEEEPVDATFWGIHDHWMLAPYFSIDFENVSILDEHENRSR